MYNLCYVRILFVCRVLHDGRRHVKYAHYDGSICLHARHIEFEHPVSHKLIAVDAPYPEGNKLWAVFG
jgi:23S rRNA pseudouridine1911/1915/1917 synthase